MSLLQGVGMFKRYSSYMGFYCIPLRDLLAKLNIKHRMCCNKPIDYKMLGSETSELPSFALY